MRRLNMMANKPHKSAYVKCMRNDMLVCHNSDTLFVYHSFQLEKFNLLPVDLFTVKICAFFSSLLTISIDIARI